MVWEIKVCRKCIKTLMSSSKTSVLPDTKREAVTNGSDAGVSGGKNKRWMGSGCRRMWCRHLGQVWSVPVGCWLWERGARLGATSCCA